MNIENGLSAEISCEIMLAELLHIIYNQRTIPVHYDDRYSAQEAERIATKAIDDYIIGNGRYKGDVAGVLIRTPVDGKPRVWMWH